jgi:phage terminase small subunit
VRANAEFVHAGADCEAVKLPARHQRFVDAYAGNAAEAARAAGYSKRTARQQGHRLLTNADVLAAIKNREKSKSEQAIASRAQRQEFWTATMRDSYEEIGARLKASELLGKSEADFTEKVEHSVSKTLDDFLREAIGGATK